MLRLLILCSLLSTVAASSCDSKYKSCIHQAMNKQTCEDRLVLCHNELLLKDTGCSGRCLSEYLPCKYGCEAFSLYNSARNFSCHNGVNGCRPTYLTCHHNCTLQCIAKCLTSHPTNNCVLRCEEMPRYTILPTSGKYVHVDL